MMDISDVATQAVKETATPKVQLDVGAALREAREGLGMSVYDIAERIKFAPKQVEALESNDFERLPKATFLRGFVRSYARVLQLDEAALIAALPTSEPSPQNIAKQQVVDVSFPGMLALRRFNLMWLAGALGVSLVLALFVWIGGSEPVEKASEIVVESVPLPQVAETSVSAVTAAPELSGIEETTKLAPPRKIEDKPLKTPVATPASVATITAASSVASTATVKPVVALEMLKRRPLHFVFSGAAWIEVVDVNGDVLLSRSNLGGTEKWIGGPRRAPYDISIGNPGNVKLFYKGKEVDLSAYAGTDTARLKVE